MVFLSTSDLGRAKVLPYYGITVVFISLSGNNSITVLYNTETKGGCEHGNEANKRNANRKGEDEDD